jgi:5'-nucleotidase
MTHTLRLRPAVLAAATIVFALAIALLPATADAGSAPRVAPLAGDWEVPGPGDPDGTGSATVTLNAGLQKVCWSINASDITLPAAAAHIHEGAVGVAGPVVVTLSPPDASGTSSGCRSGVDRGLIEDITENQQDYYVNVHTSDFPDGAIRGQLWVPGQARKVQDAVPIQFLNVSDWHAQLDPLSVTGVGTVGGAAQLSTYFKADRAANPNSLTLTAGDAYGAAPPLSSFFEERTAVMAMNLMGFDVDTFGNHNFDRGVDHLQEMIDLAEFQYVSANLENVEDNLTGVKPFEIFDMNGAKVAVIGITNPEAPELVFPGNFGTIEVTDPVAAAMEAKAQAAAAGADIFVAITHMGVTGTEGGEEVGPLIDFANAVSGFDVIFGDHTDFLFSGMLNGQLVLENRSKGATYARTDVTLDPNTGTVFNRRTEFVTPLSNAVAPDQAIVDMLAPFRAELAAAFDEVIGATTDVFVRGGNIERREEVAIGNLITDAMRLEYGTQLGFTNGGGIRAPLPSSYVPMDPSLRRSGCTADTPCDLVVGDVFTVLPFGNSVVTREVTGSQLWAMLENGVSQINSDGTGADGRFPQISGFRFTFDFSQPAGSRVVSVELADGTPIPADSTTYTLATNDFLNAGGDGYTMLADGQGVTRDVMANVVLDHIREQGTISPVVEGRIIKMG